MQVNSQNTRGIIRELTKQRNEALDRAALAGGAIEELQEALGAAQKRIKELEAPKEEVKEAA